MKGSCAGEGEGLRSLESGVQRMRKCGGVKSDAGEMDVRNERRLEENSCEFFSQAACDSQLWQWSRKLLSCS